MNDLVIHTQGLTKRFGRVLAVDQLSLEVPRGSVFGLLGPNGSGKTTVMGMLLGLVRPTSGTYWLLGPDIPQAEAPRRTGAIIETPSFYPYLSGRHNLEYFQGILGRGEPGEVDALLRLVGLADRSNDRYHTYSLGMKQRLGIACSLLGGPELLFLDEPTNGMDPAGMAEVRELIRSLGGGNRTVLLSSHLLHEVEQVCDSVAILSRGKLIAQGAVADLIRSGERVKLNATNNEEAHRILAELDWVEDVTTDGPSIVVTCPITRSWELTAALGRSQVYVTEMWPLRQSLEGYFLEVTAEDGEGEP